jgi:rare lipoprotein A
MPPQVSVQAPQPSREEPLFTQTGLASFYGAKHQGNQTADGAKFDSKGFTAAHRMLAFGTIVRVTNTLNGRMVKVAINDRGPDVKDRVIDLSSAAAHVLGMKKDGVVPVRLQVFAADQSARSGPD